MTKPVFSKPFTQQEAIPEAGIARAIEIMKTGRLHRYNLLPDEAGEAATLEMEYAKWQGADYCIACTSGGYAIQLGLRVCGVKPADESTGIIMGSHAFRPEKPASRIDPN